MVQGTKKLKVPLESSDILVSKNGFNLSASFISKEKYSIV